MREEAAGRVIRGIISATDPLRTLSNGTVSDETTMIDEKNPFDSPRRTLNKSILVKLALFFVVFILGTILGAGIYQGPLGSFFVSSISLAAAFRPIWRDGQILDRFIVFALAAVGGLAVGHFVGGLADYLFRSGTLDPEISSAIAGIRTVLAVITAYLITRLTRVASTEWLIAKWQSGSSSKLALVLTTILTPTIVIIPSAVAWEIMEQAKAENGFLAVLTGMLVTLVAFPRVHNAFAWLIEQPLFGLHDERAEGPRRLGLLAGWIFGVPGALYWHYQVVIGSSDWRPSYGDDDLVIAPLVAVIGLIVVYILVHAVFWAIDGFRQKHD